MLQKNLKKFLIFNIVIIKGEKMSKISVIIPVQNTEEFLNECLDSVVEQTEKDIEIIIIDDGSTDHSPEIEEKYQKKYPNIKLYKNERNLG